MGNDFLHRIDWKSTVRAVAPVLGSALGGPMGGLAARTLSDALLGQPDGSEEEIAAAVAGATPDQLLALKQADNEFKLKMRELGITEDKLHQEDRDSAREMATKTTLVPQMVLSAFYVIGYFTIMVLFIRGDINVAPAMKSEFNILLGMLSAPLISVIQFWFGSSKGSSEKTALLAERLK